MSAIRGKASHTHTKCVNVENGRERAVARKEIAEEMKYVKMLFVIFLS
jgi:hypothetical protein